MSASPIPTTLYRPKQFNINTPDKANAFYLSKLPMKMQDTDPAIPPCIWPIICWAAGNSRLWNRVRVKDGLSYDVRSRLDARPSNLPADGPSTPFTRRKTASVLKQP